MKNALLRMVSVLFCLGVMGVSVCAAETSETAVTGLVIEIEDVNAQVVFSTEDTFDYAYDANEIELTAEQTGTTMKISLSKKEDVESAGDMVTIAIPHKSYQSVQVRATRAGLSLPALDADLNADVQMGAFSVKVPAQFSKTYTCKIVGSSASVAFEAGAANYQFNAKMTSVAPSFPDTWPSWPWHGDYSYENGSANGKVNLEVENSSMSVTAS